MADKEAMRQTALQDSEAFNEKRRFGLFSHPISTAIGDDGPYKTKLHPRDQNGKPVINPKNFYSGPCRSGQLRKSFLGDLNSLAATTVKDQYIDPSRRLIIEENQTFSKGHKNQNKYKPASGTGSNILWKPAYPYVDEKPPQPDPKRNREEDGRVKTKLRNTFTNPGSKVVATYFKHEKHLDDPYGRAHEQELQRKKREKALEGEAKFRPNSFHANTFNKDIKVYGEDVQLKPRESKEPKFNIYHHESNWRGTSPNRHGLYGTFTPFPAHMPNPMREAKRKTPSEEKKDSFKSMNSTLSTPTPSISTNPINLRKHISQSFSLKKY